MAEPRGEVVVVTGASAGIGRAVAVEFARHGARVALLSRSEQRLAAAAHEVREAGGEALALAVDVADAAQVDQAAERVERELGPIDIWINNAMATIFSPLHEISADELERATAVTYLGTAYGTLAALRRMRGRGRGVIVQVGSALAYRSIPLQAPYCAAKFAIRGLTDALRCELIHDRLDIHLTMVQLPAHNTPQFDWGRNRMPKQPQPLPPIFQPEVAARAIHRAAYMRRRELWVGWPAVKAILAAHFAPALADRLLATRAWSGQMDDAEPAPDRPDNLFDTPSGDHATHGRFDAVARGHSRMLWLNLHRGPAVLLGGLVLLAMLLALALMVE